MNRISIGFMLLIVITSIPGLINHNSSEYYQNNSPTQKEESGVLVTLSTSDEGGMPGLELACCTDGEMHAIIALGIVFLGIPSFLVFRIIWKIVKEIIYRKNTEGGVEEEVPEINYSLGGHLPVTEKEFFEFRVKEIKERRRREEKEEGGKSEKKPFDFKEEFVIFSVFVSISLILIFGFDIFSSH